MKSSTTQTTIETIEFGDISALSIESREYPNALRKLPDAPPTLYFRGNIECLHAPAVAIVGTRKPSEANRTMAQSLGRIFAKLDFIVVSGLALGCDAAAHTGCLEANGKTIAVLAHGLNTLYPAQHRKLAAKIIKHQGCIISEHPPGTPPRRHQFITRNRLICALPSSIVAVQPGQNGGTRHSITYAQQFEVPCMTLR